MTATEWVAIVGAAAWAPQIATWAWRLIGKPRIRLIPSPILEVGYNTKGPILNLTGALSATRKDAIIERMTASVKHDDGRELSLTWAWQSETLSQARTSAGDIAEYHRSRPAVAIKVSTAILSDTLLGFQDLKFQAAENALFNSFADQVLHLRRTEVDPSVSIPKLRELHDLNEFFTRSFPWRAGRYSARLSIYLTERSSPTVQTFTFALSQIEEDRLRQNINEITRLPLEAALELPADQRAPARWFWANPVVTQAGK